jgi:peptidyl-prolyl cis-trans isomerase SurA
MKDSVEVYMKRYVVFGVLASVVALTMGVRAEIIEQILVKVNGEIITKSDLEQRQIAALREQQTPIDPSKMSDAALAKVLAEVTPEVIVQTVDELLLLQRAKELGMTISDEQFTNVLESIKKDNKMESEEQFQAALKQEGITLAQLRKMLEKRMLISQLQQREVAMRIDVTEAEEREYYNSHLQEFAATPSVTLREILVAVPTDPKGVNAAALEEAQKKAEGIRARIAKGESFEKVAGEVSEAPSKANGGLIGPIPKNELDEALGKMLAGMKPGEVTPLVRVPNGIEILKLESTIEGTTVPFDQARGQISQRLSSQRQGVAMQKYLKKLRSTALIEWKNEEIKKAYEAGVAAEPPATD